MRDNGLRSYLLTFMVPRDFILEFLDTRPEVLNWYAVFPGSVLIVSRSDLAAITGLIHVSHPWLLFLVTEVDPRSINGFMNPEVWDFINNPKPSGRWQ